MAEQETRDREQGGERDELGETAPHAGLTGRRFFSRGMVAWLSRGVNGRRRVASFVEATGTPTFTLSNLGVLAVPREYGDLVWTGFAACAGGTLTNHFGVASATLADRLRCTFVWTEPLISRDRARRIIACTRGLLEAAVRVDE